MVGGNAMSEHRQDTRVANIREFKWLLGHSVEEGRALDVSGLHFPGVQIALRYISVVTALRTVSSTSLGVGQISRRYTGLPLRSLPRESVAISKSIRPASA